MHTKSYIANYHYLYPMGTTIHIEEETRQLLERIKNKEGARSIDETIKFLMEKAKVVPPKSLFGLDKGKNIRPERAKTHEI